MGRLRGSERPCAAVCRGAKHRAPGKRGWGGAAHPDVLQVLAVDRVDDAVGADELDGAVDADVGHGATLTVLGRRRHPGPARHSPPAIVGGARPPQAAPHRDGTQDSPWIACAGPHPGAPRSGPLVSAAPENTSVRERPRHHCRMHAPPSFLGRLTRPLSAHIPSPELGFHQLHTRLQLLPDQKTELQAPNYPPPKANTTGGHLTVLECGETTDHIRPHLNERLKSPLYGDTF